MRQCRVDFTFPWFMLKSNLFLLGVTGEIVIWNDHTEELHEVPQLHDQLLTTLEWSGNGTRLASGDNVSSIIFIALLPCSMILETCNYFLSGINDFLDIFRVEYQQYGRLMTKAKCN